MKRLLLIGILMWEAIAAMAIDWTTITTSGEYYWGEGTGTTEDEAGKLALDNLLQQISVYVSSDFTSIYDGTNENGQLSHTERVRQCVQTYAQSSLTNVQTWTPSKRGGLFVVRKYMLRTELVKMYEERIKRLKDMVRLADQAEDKGDVAVALQYYYWSYSLLRSLQFPNTVQDDYGNVMLNTLPITIQEMLKNIKVEYVGRDGDFVDLHFTYKGKPCTVDFTYNDGRSDNCEGKAEGGNACVEMAPGYTDVGVYHLNVEYEYRNFARGDAEVQSVMNAIPRRSFGEEIVVKANRTTVATNKKTEDVKSVIKKASQAESSAKTDDTPQVDALRMRGNDCAQIMQEILKGLRSRQYEKVNRYFTGRGLDNFTKLITRRAGRVVGNPEITLYKSARGTIVARGLQMAFSVTEKGKKTTLVDDVIFTFNKDLKVENLTFGIGSIAENDLLCKQVDWGEETRQQIMEFMENYKTAYCLKDSDYIKAIFDDNATIIVGHVAKRTTRPGIADSKLSTLGREIITYRKYTKTQYLKNLRNTFRRNQFVNIKFTNNDVMLLDNEDGKVFSIQIGQEYSSSTYADKGYLFLMVDMTNAEEPLIKIRTWQPKPDPEFGLYGPGHFYK